MPLRRIDAGMEAVKALDPSYRRALWMDCEYLQCCDRGKLRLAEERFWDELIDKYLKVGVACRRRSISNYRSFIHSLFSRSSPPERSKLPWRVV